MYNDTTTSPPPNQVAQAPTPPISMDPTQAQPGGKPPVAPGIQHLVKALSTPNPKTGLSPIAHAGTVQAIQSAGKAGAKVAPFAFDPNTKTYTSTLTLPGAVAEAGKAGGFDKLIGQGQADEKTGQQQYDAAHQQQEGYKTKVDQTVGDFDKLQAPVYNAPQRQNIMDSPGRRNAMIALLAAGLFAPKGMRSGLQSGLGQFGGQYKTAWDQTQKEKQDDYQKKYEATRQAYDDKSKALMQKLSVYQSQEADARSDASSAQSLMLEGRKTASEAVMNRYNAGMAEIGIENGKAENKTKGAQFQAEMQAKAQQLKQEKDIALANIASSQSIAQMETAARASEAAASRAQSATFHQDEEKDKAADRHLETERLHDQEKGVGYYSRNGKSTSGAYGTSIGNLNSQVSDVVGTSNKPGYSVSPGAARSVANWIGDKKNGVTDFKDVATALATKNPALGQLSDDDRKNLYDYYTGRPSGTNAMDDPDTVKSDEMPDPNPTPSAKASPAAQTPGPDEKHPLSQAGKGGVHQPQPSASKPPDYSVAPPPHPSTKGALPPTPAAPPQGVPPTIDVSQATGHAPLRDGSTVYTIDGHNFYDKQGHFVGTK